MTTTAVHPPVPSVSPGAFPTVSVAMVTYNHERFVAQAVESVLMQETAFPYELVIGEDCSSDRTREIVSDFHRRDPSTIRLLLSDQNLGSMPNFLQTLRACQGQYIALLEGDDYWTDPRKLQAQVDFLASHPDCTICFHNVTELYDDGRRAPGLCCAANQKQISTLTDLLAGNFIPTCSVMVRNRMLAELPPWFAGLSFGDWPFNVLNAQHGDIGYLNEVMGTYRVHDLGVWSGRSTIERLKGTIAMYRVFHAQLGSRHRGAIQAGLSRCYLRLSSEYARRGDRASARRYAGKALVASAFQRGVNHTNVLARVLGLYAPGLRQFAGSVKRLL
jgi:glycosyltransferase involved in cell wall biosynthesis